MQTWPALRNAAQAPPLAATSIRSATSAQTMNGSLPPISRLTRAIRSAQAAATFLPVATEPVKATQSTSSSADDRGADVAGPGEQVDDARPAGARSSGASIRVESGVSSEGLQTVVLPAASAGASFQASSSSG